MRVTAGPGLRWTPIPSWFALGKWDGAIWITANQFVCDLRDRLANRVQLTTDGNRLYVSVVYTYFDLDVDYAVLMKLYSGSSSNTAEIRYSPAERVGCEKNPKMPSRCGTHQHVLCAAPEPHYADVNAPLY